MLLRWIPGIVGIVSGILILIGAALVILGRRAFGYAHTRNVAIAVVAFVLGLVGVAIVLAVFISILTSAASVGDVKVVAPTVRGLFLAVVVVGAVITLAPVVFTYALQKRFGQVLLWAGYGTTLLIQIVGLLLTVDDATAAIEAAVFAGRTGPLNELTARQHSAAFLGFVPALLFAAAYYLARARIDRGEIPAPRPTEDGVPEDARGLG
jgi:hypothetical protein